MPIGLIGNRERLPVGATFVTPGTVRVIISDPVPTIDLMLQRIHRGQADLRAVGVALGPGSWSGLRVGLSTAKGLALARELPVIGVGTLDALAYQHARPGLAVFPLIRLGRERYATAERGVGQGERRAVAPVNTTLAELAAGAPESALFCGDIDAEVQPTLRELLGDRARFPSPAANARRPAFLAELAWGRLQAGRTDNVASLEPIYLGQPVKHLT